MYNKGIRDAIFERIEAMPPDSAFTTTDFADVSDSTNARQALKALADSGRLVRASRGVYYKPRYSQLLQQTVPPDVDEVANAIARARGWTIAPSGDTALNRIGLDTQVPASYTYISSGPYVSLRVGQHVVRFKHSASRNLTGMSPTTLLVVQALKALGKNRVGTDEAEHISRMLSEEDKRDLLEETTRATDWIRRAICDIVGKGAS